MRLNCEKVGSGAKTIVFVHGFPFDNRMWSAQLEELSDEFTLAAPDMRGMGKSAASGASVTTMAELADDVAELLDELAIEKCTAGNFGNAIPIGWNVSSSATRARTRMLRKERQNVSQRRQKWKRKEPARFLWME